MLPLTTAATGEPRVPSPAPSQRSPQTVNAQKKPLIVASRFPRTGSGAVATGGSTLTKNSASPSATAAMKPRSCRRIGSFSSHGLSTRR